MKLFLSAVLAVMFFSGCGIRFNGKSKAAPSHDQWTTLVKKHVNAAGFVNYKGFIAEKTALQSYLDLLSANAPGKSWNEQDKIAYWLNAYNAFTIKLIVDNYPVKSIKDLGPKNQVIFINTPWDKKFFKIDGRSMTLNNIEHRILRANFTEPRIHFALNCASVSCPKLRKEAYVGSKLDAQLTEQAREFLADRSRNEVDAKTPKMSAIFDFYGKDMTKWTGKTLIQYINMYAPVKIEETAKLQYLDYNWNINEQ